MHHFRDVLVRLRAGQSERKTARAARMGRDRVAEIRERARELGWLDSASPMPSDEEVAAAFEPKAEELPAQMVSLVEPFREKVTKWVTAGVQAIVIWRALRRDHGFAGGYNSVKRFCRQVAGTLETVAATAPMLFEAGDVAQVDFGAGPLVPDPETGKERKTWIFVMTLAFSRHMYAELVWDQTVPTWLRCHRNAFNFIGGVVKRVILDNLKAGINRASVHDPVVQRAYYAFAEGYGFLVAPCVAEHPTGKARVERSVQYVKRAFVPTRSFRNLVDANVQLREWLLEEAGNRVHGTLQDVPLRLFAELEKPALEPLPDRPVELAEWAQVKLHPDCHVVFQKSYYSAPEGYVGKALWLRAGDSTVELYHEHELVATHVRASRPGTRSTVEAHLPEAHRAWRMATPEYCRAQARAVGPHCEAYVDALFGDHVVDRIRTVLGVLRLREKYGARRLEDACRRALHFGNLGYKPIKLILERGLDQSPLEEGLGGQLALPVPEEAAQGTRFGRDIGQMMSEGFHA